MRKTLNLRQNEKKGFLIFYIIFFYICIFRDQVLNKSWVVRINLKNRFSLKMTVCNSFICLFRSMSHSWGKTNCSHLAKLSSCKLCSWWILGRLLGRHRILRASSFFLLSFAIWCNQWCGMGNVWCNGVHSAWNALLWRQCWRAI